MENFDLKENKKTYIFKHISNGQVANITDEYLIEEFINNPEWTIGDETDLPKPFIYEEPKPTYDELVDNKIRQRYSLSQELAILRQRDVKPQEYKEYNNYCEQCKLEAKEEIKN